MANPTKRTPEDTLRTAGRSFGKNPFSGQNRTKKHRAAILLAEDHLSDEAIAAEVGVARSALSRWKRDPEFAAIVGDYQGAIIGQALKLPVAKKHERIKQLNDLNESYWQIIAERAERHREEIENPLVDPDYATPAEATTGMLVKQMKIAANGKTVTEWAFDKSLDSAIKETHKQAAQELGQWADKVDITGEIDHNVRRPDLSRLSDEQLEALEQIASQAASEGAE